MIIRKLNKHRWLLLTVLLCSALCSGCLRTDLGRAAPKMSLTSGDYAEAGEATDRLLVESNIQNFTDKYRRHFAGGIYFEDLEAAKQKLNEEYRQYLIKQLDPLFPHPYILRIKAEFVNREVKAYAEGSKTLQDLLAEPGKNLMSLQGEFFGFRRNPKKEYYTYDETVEFQYFKKLGQEYVAAGVDFIQIWFNEYPISVLEKYPLEELQQQENLFLYLKDVYNKVISGYVKKTYYDGGYSQKGEPPVATFSSGMPQVPYPGKENPTRELRADQQYVELIDDDWKVEYRLRDNLYHLQKKYGMEFFQIADEFYAPVAYPEMFFESFHNYALFHPSHNPSGWDYFLGLYYQHLMNQRLEKLLAEQGLSDDVLYFVQTEPQALDYGGGLKVNTSEDPYPFGQKGYTEERFLTDDYTGSVYVNLIVLEESGKSIDEAKLQEVIRQIEIWIGVPGRNERRKLRPELGHRIIKKHVYIIDAYGKKVVRELFQKHPLTERADNPAPTFRTAFADRFNVRTETEGFIYLDIFAEKIEPKEDNPREDEEIIEMGEREEGAQ